MESPGGWRRELTPRKSLDNCIRNDTVMQLPAVFFRTESGREPVREWLKDLANNERKIIGEDIMTVQFRWPLPDVSGLVDHLGSGIWEVRTKLPTRIARTLFFVHEGEIVLLHGFIKKTRRTPQEDRALALQRKNAYIKSIKN
jgi:phage-related protein